MKNIAFRGNWCCFKIILQSEASQVPVQLFLTLCTLYTLLKENTNIIELTTHTVSRPILTSESEEEKLEEEFLT